MFIGVGTAINLIAILLGSTIGIAVGQRLKSGSDKFITDIL